MKLSVLAVGRLKPGPEKILADDYAGRCRVLGRKAGLSEVRIVEFAESRAQTALGRSEDEAQLLAAKLPQGAFSVVLDMTGKGLGSEAFAALLSAHLERGTPHLAFLIGGPDGHAEASRAQADLLLSLGPMTWPHRLVRVMLLEQIYRAVTIMVNHPYHRP